MRGMRGLLVVTGITLIVIGLIRGAVIWIISPIAASTALELIALNIGLALIWLPITALVMQLIDGRLTKRDRVVALVTLGIASIIVETWLASILRFAGAPRLSFVRRLVGRSDTNVLFYVAIVGACFAVRARVRQLASDVAAARMQAAAADAQLRVLTLQLHPHFLFNALNLISQLAYESVDAALRAVANLRALLVESLRHAAHREVSLADELSFLRAYLEIQQARFRDRLRVTIAAPPDVERAAVPHLVLQPIVENAIVHGISPRSTAGNVNISARRAADRLVLTVEDDGGGIAADMRNGVGLTNTRLRLEQLFGADHGLELSTRRPRGAKVTIDIPFRETDGVATDADESIDGIAATASDDEPPTRRRASVWLSVVAAWAAVAMMWTEIGALPTASRPHDFDYTATLVAYLLNAGLWILLTPIPVWLARRFDLGMRPTRRVILVHATACFVTATIHTAAWLATLYAINSPVFATNLRSMFGWGIWDLVAYIAVVALATIVSLSARFRDSRVAMARAHAQLASARVASLRLRLQPRVLLASLDALARVIALDAEASEATIARIGDLLRMLLSRADRELVSIGEELELLEAYLDVIQEPGSAPRPPSDLPRVTDVVDELVPAMLLPTSAAAFHGEMDIVRLQVVDAQVSIAVRGRTSAVDQAAVRECLERLHGLYNGRERASVEREDAGCTIVELELPRVNERSLNGSETYDLATA